MRMKFFRIFPEICANTWCLFSNSTRNIAFGRGSITVAITSMASSLGKRLLPSAFDWNAVDDGENLLRHFIDRPHAVHLMINTTLLVILHQWVCFLVICPEPFFHQVFPIIGPVEQTPTANI